MLHSGRSQSARRVSAERPSVSFLVTIEAMPGISLKSRLMMSVAVSLCSVLIPAECATYYVAKTGSDSNACTQAQPCLTIGRATSLATRPGAIIQVGAGTFTESLTISHGGSSGQNILFRGQDGSGCPMTPTLDVNHPTGKRPRSSVIISGAWTIAASYVTVDCFHFESTGNGTLYISPKTTGGSITNSEFDGNGLSNPGSGPQFNGVGSSSSTSYASSYTVQGNYIHGVSTGIWLACNSCQISENEITSLSGDEPGTDHDYIDAWGTNTIIRHNYMWNNTSNACDGYDCHMDCIQTWNTTANGTEVSKNITFDRNVCFNHMEGVIVQDNAGNGDVADWTVTNNVFAYGPWDDGSGHLAAAGTVHPWCWVFEDGNLGSGVFANNTCIDGMAGFRNTNGSSIYKNNIYYLSSTGSVYSNAGSSSTGANNLYYVVGQTLTATYPGDIVNKKPIFISFGNGSANQRCIGCNFSLQATSPAIDHGVNTSPLVGFDLKGVTRPQGEAYDIGAYEIIPGQSPLPPANVTATRH